MSRLLVLILVIVAVAAVFFVGYWFWLRDKQAPSSQGAPTLGSEIFDKTQNQLQGQVPDTNPFKGQKNPFDTIYKNPFE